MLKNCECCGKESNIMSSGKFCNNCSLYIFRLKQTINQLKTKIKKLEEKLKEKRKVEVWHS